MQFALAFGAGAAEIQERADLEKYFNGFNGTFVLYDPSNDSYKELAVDIGPERMQEYGSGLQDGKWVLGWFVGYIEHQGKYYVFATNIEGKDGAIGGKAREITKAIARDLSLL